MDQEIPSSPQSVQTAPQESLPPTPPVQINKPINPLIFIFVGVLILTAGAGGYYLTTKTTKPTSVACTMEAKICPDGSAVGRTGPKCEFAPCPITTPDPTANWKTYTNNSLGFSLKHPDIFTITSSSIPNNGSQITFSSDRRTILIIKRSNINPSTNQPYDSLEQFDPRTKNYITTQIGQLSVLDSGIYETQGGTRQRDIVFQTKTAIWVIQDILLLDKSNEMFDQILSTFKDQNVSTDISTWNTYEYEKYGFSFKYPPEYLVEERDPGFLVIVSPNEKDIALAGIAIDARLMESNTSYTAAKNQITSSNTITETKTVGNWEVFQGTGKEELVKGQEFRFGIIPYKSGALGTVTFPASQYIKVFDQILSTFKFTK